MTSLLEYMCNFCAGQYFQSLSTHVVVLEVVVRVLEAVIYDIDPNTFATVAQWKCLDHIEVDGGQVRTSAGVSLKDLEI